MRILIADDDAVSRLLLKTTLVKLGHEVVETENGRHAWDMYQREYFPIVISDWVMPELDGLDLCRAVRGGHHGKYTFVVLVTVLDGKPRYIEGMNAGADDFITKPIDADELGARLRVAERVLSLQEEVKYLKGLLSTCMYCKKIREGDVWVSIERYISERAEVSFSHGICPECLETKLRPAMEQARRLRESRSVSG